MIGLTRGGNKVISLRRAEEEFLERKLQQFLADKSAGELASITKAIGQATRVIMAKLQQLEKRMSTLDELLGLVEAQQTKIDSLITLTDGLRQQVLDAMGEVITPSQAMRINAVFDAVKANSVDIDNALKANTPEAAAGAVSGGPSFADIKAGNVDPPSGTSLPGEESPAT